MSTLLQKNLAREIVKNAKRKRPLNKQELVVLGGYSTAVAEGKPQVILQQKGVQDELHELGFNEYSAKKVVREIMLSKKADGNARLKAADMVFKVHGSYAPEKRVTKNLNMALSDFDNETLEGLIAEEESAS